MPYSFEEEHFPEKKDQYGVSQQSSELQQPELYKQGMASQASQSPQIAETPSGTEGASSAAMASGNPYAMGAGFLLKYMEAKDAQFRAKQNAEMQQAQNYEKSQSGALNSMQQAWARALGR